MAILLTTDIGADLDKVPRILQVMNKPLKPSTLTSAGL